ncbi:MAG: class I SAM-dependent methyltransferase [Clostridia bacterium]|nr:class I SAM-dependent methyltransferase [Clostridia bacterium]
MSSKGEQYLRELDLEAANSFKALRKLITKKVDAEVADNIIRMIYQRGAAAAEGEDLGEKEFYDYKNADYNRGMTVSAAFDGNIMADSCDWIHEHRTSFGEQILDVGCDTGIVSCFLAREFPESHITAIDDGEAGVVIAKELAHRLSLFNIEFKCIKLEEETGKYDTVFSSRVLHENLLFSKFSGFAPFKEKCIHASSAVLPYLEQLQERIATGGNLISIERLATGASKVGYKIALNKCGLCADEDSFGELKCKTMGETEVLTTTIAAKIVGGDELSADEIVQRTVDSWIDKTPLMYNHYPDDTGEMLLHADGGNLIKGCYIVEGNDIVAKNALYSSISDETKVYCVMDSLDDGINLYVQDRSMLNELIEQFDQACKSLKKQGVSVRKFKVGADGKEIIENFKNSKSSSTSKGKSKSKNKKKRKKK